MEQRMTDDINENQWIRLRGGFSMTTTVISQINTRLKNLLELVPARYILLVDSSGQIVTALGETGGIDAAVLGSLIAADMAASQEIAQITSELQYFQMVLREGEKTHIIITEAGTHLVFLVLFSKDTPIGWARKLIQKTAHEISDDTKQIENQEVVPGTTDGPKGDLHDLFNDALDQIWKE
jgi:predicted regulator of Ras-like GTPase activity (Roadblock/LC7/MglB family)